MCLLVVETYNTLDSQTHYISHCIHVYAALRDTHFTHRRDRVGRVCVYFRTPI